MNMRPPMPVQEGFLDVQDAYLLEESSRRGIVDCSNLSPVRANSRLFLWQGDITRLQADAIVNAANSAFWGVFSPAIPVLTMPSTPARASSSGSPAMRSCRRRVMKRRQAPPKSRQGITFPAGMCCIRWGRWCPGSSGNERQAFGRLLSVLPGYGCKKRGAFHRVCCISTGVFRFPQDRAAEIAVQTVSPVPDPGPIHPSGDFSMSLPTGTLSSIKRLLER